MPSECPFAPRCRYALPRCTEQLPPLTSPAIRSDSRRLVACWLHEEGEPPDELASATTANFFRLFGKAAA